MDRRPVREQARDAYADRLLWLGLAFVMLSPIVGVLLGRVF